MHLRMQVPRFCQWPPSATPVIFLIHSGSQKLTWSSQTCTSQVLVIACSSVRSLFFILPVFARHRVPLENMAVGARHTRIRHAARRTSFTRKRLPCRTMSARMNIAHLGNVRNEYLLLDEYGLWLMLTDLLTCGTGSWGWEHTREEWHVRLWRMGLISGETDAKY